jgi:DNA-binding MarR family transcriptional regulator
MSKIKDLLQKDDFAARIANARSESYVEHQKYKAEQLDGVIVPNSTQVPNEVLDRMLPHLSLSELKVLLFLVRKTFGYGKSRGDYIPLSQILKGDGISMGTGLTKKSALSAISTLEKAGLIRVVRGKDESGTRKVNYYQLITRENYYVKARKKSKG